MSSHLEGKRTCVKSSRCTILQMAHCVFPQKGEGNEGAAMFQYVLFCPITLRGRMWQENSIYKSPIMALLAFVLDPASIFSALYEIVGGRAFPRKRKRKRNCSS